MKKVEISIQKWKLQKETKQTIWSWKYNKWNEKFTRLVQAGRRKNQWTLQYSNWYWVWGIERKKNEENWTNFKGIVVYYQAYA